MIKSIHIFIFLGLLSFFLLSKANRCVSKNVEGAEFTFANYSKQFLKQNPKLVKENSSTEKTLTYEVVFAMNKSYLSLALKEKLDRVYKVYTTNHTDTINIISKTSGDNLYKERSINVTNYLISKGVPSSHIRYIAFGKIKTGNGIEVIIKE